MKKLKKKLLSLTLLFAMIINIFPFGMIEHVYATTDTRTKVNSVTATSNIDDILKYSGTTSDPTFTVNGGTVYFYKSGGGWQKKDGDNWANYTGTVFTEGTYRYTSQIRIDGDEGTNGTTHVLDSAGVTTTVDSEEWTTSSRISVGDTFSYTWVYSPEYVVAKIAELPLNFTKNDNWDIGTNYANRTITSFSVADGVIGGTKPYTFSKVSGPDWLNVANDGTVSGTPTAIGTNNNLVIKVTDSANNTKEITLSVANTKMNPADRTKVSSVTATSNIDDILKYNGTTSDPTFTVNGGTVYFYKSGGGWQKKDGDNWANYTGSVFTEGTYRYTSQIRIDGDEGTNGTTHVLDSAGVTTTVDSEEWTTSSRISVGDTYSYTWVTSLEYVITSSSTPTSYTVTFNTNGGTPVPETQTIANGSTVQKPADPTREGYTFDGWYTERTFVNKFNFSTAVTAPYELHAKWLNNYTYKYVKTTDTDVYASINVVDTKNPTQPSTNPTRDGYEFVEWYTDSTRQTEFDPTTDVVSGNKTIYAGWNRVLDSANIIFDNSNINDSMTGNELRSKISIATDADYTKATTTIYQCNSNSACTRREAHSITDSTLELNKYTFISIRLEPKNDNSVGVKSTKFKLNENDITITVNSNTYTGLSASSYETYLDVFLPVTVSVNTTISYPTKPTALSETSYTYDGNNHLPTVNGFDSNTMTISGNTEQKYVGTYTITVSPKEQWSDGTNTAINLSWSIVAEPKSDSTSYLTMSVGSNKTKGMLEAIVGKTGIVANLTDSSKGTYTLDGGFTATNAGVTSLVYTIPAEDVNNDGKPEYSEYTVTITITVVDDSTPSYSYDFLENTGEQNYTSGNLTSYVIKVDADYTTFKSLKVNGELFTKDTDYEVTEGSTIITFTQAGLNKINNLAAGDYNVEIEFDEEIVTAELKLSAGNNEHNANQNDVQDNNQNTNIDNPKTFDGGIINYVLLSILSILGLSGAIIVRKKRTRA